jgi:hypothetical protein
MSARRFAALIGLLAFALAVSGFARAEAPRRVALIIANADDVNGGSLKNPLSDAVLIESFLEKCGFQVVETEANLGIGDFNHALRAFSAQAADGSPKSARSDLSTIDGFQWDGSIGLAVLRDSGQSRSRNFSARTPPQPPW